MAKLLREEFKTQIIHVSKTKDQKMKKLRASLVIHMCSLGPRGQVQGQLGLCSKRRQERKEKCNQDIVYKKESILNKRGEKEQKRGWGGGKREKREESGKSYYKNLNKEKNRKRNKIRQVDDSSNPTKCLY